MRRKQTPPCQSMYWHSQLPQSASPRHLTAFDICTYEYFLQLLCILTVELSSNKRQSIYNIKPVVPKQWVLNLLTTAHAAPGGTEPLNKQYSFGATLKGEVKSFLPTGFSLVLLPLLVREEQVELYIMTGWFLSKINPCRNVSLTRYWRCLVAICGSAAPSHMASKHLLPNLLAGFLLKRHRRRD